MLLAQTYQSFLWGLYNIHLCQAHWIYICKDFKRVKILHFSFSMLLGCSNGIVHYLNSSLVWHFQQFRSLFTSMNLGYWRSVVYQKDHHYSTYQTSFNQIYHLNQRNNHLTNLWKLHLAILLYYFLSFYYNDRLPVMQVLQTMHDRQMFASSTTSDPRAWLILT